MAELLTHPAVQAARPGVGIPKGKKSTRPALVLRVLPVVEDRTFLSSALEIVETPASPVRIAMMLSICLLTTTALAWSWFGEIDIHAAARGKVEPTGHSKVVQPLEAGIVAEVHVVDGQAVHAGDVLLVLDGREAAAELATATATQIAAEAEAVRRGAEIELVRARMLEHLAMPSWPAEVPLRTRGREEAVLREDLAELSATLVNLGAQEGEKQAAVKQLEMSMEAEQALLQREAERVGLRQTLASDGNGSKLTLLDAQQSLLETRTQLAGDIGRHGQAVAALASLETERRKTVETFLADDARKQSDAARLADEKREERARAQARLDRLTLRAPVDGIVQGLAVTNPGQVVTVSQEVMRLVPAGLPMEILAYITNDDIGFVAPGQRAVVKVDSFPFTRFGTIEAEVVEVAADAVTSEAAGQEQGDATKAGGRTTQGLTPQAQPMADLVFAAQLRPLVQKLAVNGRDVSLLPGMTVSVEIKTGKRRVLEYLFSPIAEVASSAGTER